MADEIIKALLNEGQPSLSNPNTVYDAHAVVSCDACGEAGFYRPVAATVYTTHFGETKPVTPQTRLCPSCYLHRSR